MRISDGILRVAAIGFGVGLASTAMAFDGSRTPEGAPIAGSGVSRSLGAAPLPEVQMGAPIVGRRAAPLPARQTPFEAFRSGTQALRAGNTDQAVTSLQYAAEQGVAAAQWKLGRMYAEGEGVDRNNLRAFEYFQRIANTHADDNPNTPQARFVANAFVSLGHYYLEGIPNSPVRADALRAQQMYAYAASYFGDADAQFHLGRLLLAGQGGAKDPRQAARWLRLAANKGHSPAQAMLGSLLFNGSEAVARQAALGLMWLTLAKDGAASDQAWIAEKYASAFKSASEDERAMALMYLESFMKTRRE
jgi:TPR repeat protein